MSDSTALPGGILGCGMEWLCAGERESRWIRGIFVILALSYFVCLALFQGGPVNEDGNDILLLLDGGWRILNGQIPHRDFYNAMGPLEYMMAASGMYVTGASPQGIAIANVAFGLVIGIWGWLLSRKRMLFIPAMLVTIWLVLTATCPTPLGSPPTAISNAMIYNRHAYALLGLILVECAFVDACSRFWGGVSTGVALVLLAFLKLNFFGAAFLLILTTFSLRRDEVRRLWGVLTGVALATAAWSAYLRSAMWTFLSDMSLAAHARTSSLSLKRIIGEIPESADLVTMVIATILAVMLITQGARWRKAHVRLVLLSVVLMTAGNLVRRTNMNESNFVLVTLWTLILVGYLAAAYPQTKDKMAICVFIALGLGGVASQFYGNGRSMLTLLRYWAPSTWGTGASMSGRKMEHLRFFDRSDSYFRSGDNGLLYVAYVNDGAALLTRSSAPRESVLSLGFQSPFSYLLRRKPATGGSVWLLMGNNISAAHLPDAKRIFGDADLIMVPHYESTHRQSDLQIEAAYNGYLEQHFDFVSQSQWWSLYRRKK